jgi:hypothetical protein
MQVMMDDSVTELCGPKGRHDPDRQGVRRLRLLALTVGLRIAAAVIPCGSESP